MFVSVNTSLTLCTLPLILVCTQDAMLVYITQTLKSDVTIAKCAVVVSALITVHIILTQSVTIQSQRLYQS